MTNFQIEFTHPWLLLLLVPALFFALFPYFRLSKKYRKTRNRITSIVLHMLVMVLSISVLSGINFKYELPNTRNELILLVDGSFSGSETEEAKNNFVQAVLNECEPEMRVGIVTFGFNQVYAAAADDGQKQSVQTVSRSGKAGRLGYRHSVGAAIRGRNF